MLRIMQHNEKSHKQFDVGHLMSLQAFPQELQASLQEASARKTLHMSPRARWPSTPNLEALAARPG
jgi:hypothetical protein